MAVCAFQATNLLKTIKFTHIDQVQQPQETEPNVQYRATSEQISKSNEKLKEV